MTLNVIQIRTMSRSSEKGLGVETSEKGTTECSVGVVVGG